MEKKKINNNGFEYVDLELPSGTLWATMNVGASKPSDYGLYFQWGDTQGYTAEQVGTGEGKKKFASDESDYKCGVYPNYTKYTVTGATLDLEDDAAHANMGGEWHMPSPTQIRELINTANTTSTWTTQDGVNGRLFTSKKDGTKSIFIPAAGGAWDGSVRGSGDGGYIWSSMLNPGIVGGGQHLGFNSGSVDLNYGYVRCYGLSVRGVVDGTNAKNAIVDEMLDLVSILKDVPEGTKLWSPVCGECELDEINYDTANIAKPRITVLYRVPGTIRTKALFFDNYGVTYNCPNGECLLFPSKENRDWLTLRPSKSHKEFEIFQKVLVKDWRDKKWVAGFYSNYDDSQNKHCLVGFSMVDDEDIIPYDGNEDKIGEAIE